MSLQNERVGEPSELGQKADGSLQYGELQTPEDVDQCKARKFVVWSFIPKLSTIAASEWTLNLAGLLCVNVAGLVISLMEVCYWKDNAVVTNIQQKETKKGK